MIKKLLYPINLIMMGFVYLYKIFISPLIPHTCRFYPSCSSYAVMAFKEYGVFYGFYLALKRLIKCRPNSKYYGFDPLPQNIKGDSKWII